MKCSRMLDRTRAIPLDFDKIEDLAPYIETCDIAFGVFKDNYRHADNFLQADIMGFDFDGELTIAEATQRLAGYAYLLAPSKSHQKEKNGVICDRFHVFMLLEKPITDIKVYKATYQAFSRRLLPEVDPQCANASRYFYVGHPVTHRNNGAPVPVVEALSPGRPKIGKGTIKGRLSQQTWEAIKRGPTWGQPGNTFRHDLFGVFRNARECGYTEEEIANYKSPIHQILHGGKWNDDDLKCLESAFDESNPPLRSAIPNNPYEGAKIAINAQDHLDSRLVLEEKMCVIARDLKSCAAKLEGAERFDAIFEYEPNKHTLYTFNEIGETVLNTYNPPAWKKRYFYHNDPIEPAKLPDFYRDLFMHLMNNDQASYDYLLDWLATSLHERNYTFLVTISEEGAGKGVLFDIVELLHDKENSHQGRDQVLKSHFNAQLINKTFFNIDEINLDREDAIDRLKALSNDFIEVEVKGKDARRYRNYANIMLSTNKLDGIKLSAGDRRYSIVQFTDTPLKYTKWIGPISEHKHMYPELIAQLGRYLWHHQVRHNMKETFKDKSKLEEIKEAGLRDWERYILYEMNQQYAGQTRSAKEVQQDIQDRFRFTVGARKIWDLSKRYPHFLDVKAPEYNVRFLGSGVVSLDDHRSEDSKLNKIWGKTFSTKGGL